MQGRGRQEQQEIAYVQETDQMNKYLKDKESRSLTVGASNYNYDREITRMKWIEISDISVNLCFNLDR